MNQRRPNAREHFHALVDFASDGCTMAPGLDIEPCCWIHDFAYRNGRAFSGEAITRREADRQLRDCLRRYGHPILCWRYWLAVRLFAGRAWKSRNSTMENL